MTQISIIIPVFNEASIIQETLKHLKDESNTEVIVVDGGSQDQTVKLVQGLGVKVIHCSTKGRANQMNFAAENAIGEILLFLHADTYLPSGYQDLIKEALSQPKTIAGAFELAIAGQQPLLRWVEAIVNLRSRFFSLPYGDQALFIKASIFVETGGFPNLPIMEDFEFIQRLKRLGKITIVSAAVLTSGRRWQTLGVLKTTLINQLVIIGYYLGISPTQLVRLYQGKQRLGKSENE